MKRILVILILTVLISGCSVNYEVKIGGSTLKESTTFIDNQKDTAEINTAMSTYTNVFFHDGFNPFEIIQYSNRKYYNKSIVNEGYGVNFNYVFDFEKYSGSSVANYCFEDLFFGTSGNEYYLDTRKGNFTCFDKYPELTDVTVKIIIDTEVFEHNASTVAGNEYTWMFNRNNASTASVYIYFLEPKYDPSEGINVIDPSSSNVIDPSSSNDNDYQSSSSDINSSSHIDSDSSSEDESSSKNANNSPLVAIVMGGVAGVLLLFIVIITIKYRRSNKL